MLQGLMEHEKAYIPFLSLVLLSFCSVALKIKMTSGGQLAPACCSMWSRQVDAGETEQRSRTKKLKTVSVKVKYIVKK